MNRKQPADSQVGAMFLKNYQNEILPPSSTTGTATAKETAQGKIAEAITKLQTRLFDVDKGLPKPFWIWNEREHRRQDRRCKGDCCFNHIIGLPRKDGEEKAIFDYERLIYDALIQHKRVWIKKATGLGVTEFMLRFMAWLAFSRQDNVNLYSNFAIVTGPRIDLAIDLISRLKALFQNCAITFEDKNTVVNLGRVQIEAFPSHHLDSMRGLTDVKFIFLDEADFFPKGQQQDARDVSERYIGKSDAMIAMVSTPNAPDGLFARIEQEKALDTIYHRLVLGYQVGLGTIYTNQDIERARRSPSFEREYNLKYLGAIGNVFNPADIDAAIAIDYPIVQYTDDLLFPPRLQAVMGCDPGWGSSNFGIVISHFVDGKIRIVHSSQAVRANHDEMVDVVWDLIQRYNVTKVLIDASAPSFIRALKLQWGERSDYENVEKRQREYMKAEPVAFSLEHKTMLYHAKFMLENHYVEIHPTMDKLITALRSAWAKDGTLDKEITSFDDILDAFRLCLRPYREQGQQATLTEGLSLPTTATTTTTDDDMIA